MEYWQKETGRAPLSLLLSLGGRHLTKILVGSLANSFVFYLYNLMTNKTYLIIIWLLGLLNRIQIWKRITLTITLKSHEAWIQVHTASKDRGSGILIWTGAPPSIIVDASSILIQPPEQSQQTRHSLKQRSITGNIGKHNCSWRKYFSEFLAFVALHSSFYLTALYTQ